MTTPTTLTGTLTAKSYGVPATIYAAVSDASAQTGVSFSYLMTKARTESNFDTDAQSKSSSATGLYQFVENTWLDMIDRHGEDYGLGDMADKITRTKSGGYSVEGGYATRKEILALRDDPEISAQMAAEYAGENASYLSQRLGREVSDTDLYMAHFLGAGGAGKFLSAMAKDSDTSAASIVPRAARANKSIFYNHDGSAKSLGEVYASFDKRFSSDTSYYALNDTGILADRSMVADASDLPVITSDEDDGDAVLSDALAEASDIARAKTLTGAIVGDEFYLTDATSRSQSGSGEIPGANAPFMTSYLMAALEATSDADQNVARSEGHVLYGATPASVSSSGSLFDGLFA